MDKNKINLNSKSKPEKELKSNLDNEKIKNEYFHFLKESESYSEQTINAHKKAIFRYEEFSGFDDFRNYNKKKAVEYKKWLEEKKDPRTNKQISITTVYHYLRNLKEFFEWISIQPKYKSKILLTDLNYLKLSRSQVRIATSSKRERFPTLEQVQKVVESIEINNEIDLRDRALISFTLLSGMRDGAIITLPIDCFDETKLSVSQDPKRGVKTKFSKTINNVLFRFDANMLKYFIDWYKFLRSDKLFGNNDPVFPRNKVVNAENTKSFVSNEVEPYFWQSVSSMREIFKQRFDFAGIEYFSPHTFRHLAVMTAISKCKNGHEIKAVSQNFGHEDVGTTMTTYGTLSNTQVSNIIIAMDFTGNNSDSEFMAKLKAFIESQQGGQF